MGAEQIKMITAGEEAEALCGCCCQPTTFGKAERIDHTQMCLITGPFTKIER